MKARSVTLFLLLMVGVLSSCDYFIIQEGWVVDSQTKEPIGQVQVELLINNDDNRTPLGYEFDTLTIESRDSLNKALGIGKKWEEQGWYVSVPSIETGRYARHVPLKTDSVGYFNVLLHTVYYSKYNFKFTKTGYFEKVVTDEDIERLFWQQKDTLIVSMEKIKPSHFIN
ncbi:hypothetical protein [Pontibacter sp. H249]|uniref:hypothetical protein n=1 Tax=Pontibacter sp. H249 TaxID=3133420 RepID=UPI0030C12F5A